MKELQSLEKNKIGQSGTISVDCIIDNTITKNDIELSDILSKFDDDTFKNYLSILKSILLLINKIKLKYLDFSNLSSKKFYKLEDISKEIKFKNIFNRLEFLSNNEKDLFNLNLDKKMFILNFIIN